MNNSQTILDFWFKEIDSSLWWQKNAEFDELIRQRFAKTHQQATRGELAHWRTDAHGRLAEIIVLDQFLVLTDFCFLWHIPIWTNSNSSLKLINSLSLQSYT